MSKIPSRNQEWDIKPRAAACARTGRPFKDKEVLWTLLFDEGAGFRREDVCEDAWREIRDAPEGSVEKPFSFWKTRYNPPPEQEPEPLGKEGAEQMLRRLMSEFSESGANTCYILALMLERKRILKQTDSRFDGQGRILIYEHSSTGEVFMIRDPMLRLDQIEEVQREVYAALGAAEFGGSPAPRVTSAAPA